MATTNFLLPGFEPAFVEQKNAAALLKEEEQKQLVEAALRTPAADISKAAGEMERHSPLFFGLAELEQQTLFGSVAPVGSSARNIKAGDATAATAAPTWSLFAEQEAAGERSEKKAKQREAQAIIEARRDHLAELLVEKGFAPNAFVLELNRSISTGKLQLSYPWNLPTRLMRFPIETSRDQVWDGEAKRWIYYPRTIGIIHPLLSEHPLVKQIEETIERKLEVGGGANQYGVSSTGHGEWWHALDLLAKGMTRELLDTRRFTSDEGIACGLTYALHYGEGNKPYTSIKDARMLLETIGATEPATRDAFRTLCSQPSLSDKNWPVNFRCNREGKRDAKAQAWVYIHGLEDGIFAIKGGFIGWTAKGRKAFESIAPLIPPPAPKAKNAKRQTKPLNGLVVLRKDLADAQATVEETGDMIVAIDTHLNAHRQGRIDGNWWDGAMRHGFLDYEFWSGRTDGKYPIAVVRCLRHNRAELHQQLRAAALAVNEITEKIFALAQPIEPATHTNLPQVNQGHPQ